MAPDAQRAPPGDDERFDWLRLIRSDNIGPRTFQALLERFGSARAALEALPDLVRRSGLSRPVRIATREEVERELAAARRLGARFLTQRDAAYPPALAATAGAPPVMAMIGREEALQQPAVAIVGSRNASAAGAAFADRLARGLGAGGYVVVSGLARGIDLRAHVAALPTGTIGVLAGGLARPYPPEAAPLLPRIAEFGAVVSEMPIEWEPRGRDFPRRNRIVSGLALATVVVEAARGSGSLITARYAGDQGREVFAVPGSPLDPRAEGTNDLLRDGAQICARVEDVLEALDRLRDRLVFAAPSQASGSFEETGLTEEDDLAPEAPGAFEDDEEALVRRVATLLGPSPVTLDDLALAAELDARRVRMAVAVLDLAGRIEYAGGDRVALRVAQFGE
jgi:DNA processing protein